MEVISFEHVRTNATIHIAAAELSLTGVTRSLYLLLFLPSTENEKCNMNIIFSPKMENEK